MLALLLSLILYTVVRATDRLAPGLNLLYKSVLVRSANYKLVPLQDHYLISYDNLPVNLNDICVHSEGLNLGTGKDMLY